MRNSKLYGLALAVALLTLPLALLSWTLVEKAYVMVLAGENVMVAVFGVQVMTSMW
mgnify:CR=1 FL=1